jgi:hypothetical protein
MLVLCAGAAFAMSIGGPAVAHTLLIDCYNVAGGVVACRSLYANGELAPGAQVTLYSEQNVKLGEGKTDEHGVYLFKPPPDDYVVVITAGAAHITSLASPDIGEKPRRLGWGGDWIPVATVDRLQKLQQWEAQFTSERAPLVERAEQELAK